MIGYCQILFHWIIIVIFSCFQLLITSSPIENCTEYSIKKDIRVNLKMNDWVPYNRNNLCACGINCFWDDNSDTSKADVVIILHHMHYFNDREWHRNFPEQVVAIMELEPPIPGTFISSFYSHIPHIKILIFLSTLTSIIKIMLFNRTSQLWCKFKAC